MDQRPVADVKPAAEIQRELAHDRGRLERILHRQPDAGDPVSQLVEPRRIRHVHQGEAAVELIHAGFEQPGHLEAPHARKNTGGRSGSVGCDDDHGISDTRIQLASERNAQNDAVLAGL